MQSDLKNLINVTKTNRKETQQKDTQETDHFSKSRSHGTLNSLRGLGGTLRAASSETCSQPAAEYKMRTVWLINFATCKIKIKAFQQASMDLRSKEEAKRDDIALRSGG